MTKIPSSKFSTIKKKISSSKFPKSQDKISSRKFAKGTAKLASRKVPYAPKVANKNPDAPTIEESHQDRLASLKEKLKSMKPASKSE